MRTSVTILSGVLSVAAMTAAASASVSTLTPDFGSYTAGDGAMGTVLNGSSVNSNKVEASIDRVGYYPPYSYNEERGIIEIGISSIPSTATINSASLVFTLSSNSHPYGSYSQLKIYGYAGDGTVTTSDYGNVSGTLLATIDASSFSSHVYTIDVTALLQTIRLDSAAYIGFLAEDTGDGHPNSYYKFNTSWSNDCGQNEWNGPKLVVDWSPGTGEPPVPEPASLAILALPAGAMIMKRRK